MFSGLLNVPLEHVADGQQAVYDALIGTLCTRFTAPTASLAIKIRLISNVMDILDKNKRTTSKLTRCDPDEVRAVFSDCKESKDSTYLAIARRFLAHFTTCLSFPLSFSICRANAGIVADIKPQHVLAVDSHDDPVSKLATIRDSHELFGAGNHTCHVWSSRSGARQVYSSNRFSAPVISLAVSPDGKVLVSGLMDGTICFRANQTGAAVFAGQSEVKVHFSLTQREMSSAKGHTSSVRSVAFCPSGHLVVSGGDDQTVRIWDVARGSQIGEPFEASDSVLAVMFAHGGEHIMSLSKDQTVRVWNVATRCMVGEPLRLPGHLVGHIECGALSFNGNSVIVGTDNGEVMMWNLNDAQVVGIPCLPHQAIVNSVAFSYDTAKLASASSDRTIQILDTKTQELKCQIPHKNRVSDVSFFPDGKHVASVCDEHLIRIWDIEPLRDIEPWW